MGMEIGAVQVPGADIGAVQSTITQTSGSFTLFILGHIIETDNVDLFIDGLDTEVSDINLFILGDDTINDSITLFINGNDIVINNLDLIILSKDSKDQNLDLFVSGPIQTTENINLFINGKESSTNNLDLFISGSIIFSSSNNIDLFINGTISGLPPIETGDDDFGITLEQLFKNADYNPQIIGRFTGDPNSITIEIWDGDGNIIVLTNSNCYQIGDTGRWAWSTINLPPLTKIANQFVFRMTGDNLEVFTSQFILHTRRKNSYDKIPRDNSQIRSI